MPTAYQDYYSALGVSKDASEKTIKSAFRKIARESHPDTHPGDTAAEERFKTANEAYTVLGDPEKRKKYDQVGSQWQEYEQWEKAGRPGANPFGSTQFGDGGQQFQHQTYSTSDFDQIFGGGGGGGFSDFFQTFFGGQNPSTARGRRRAVTGGDIEAISDITLEEAYTGTRRTVEIGDGRQARRIEVNIPAGIRDGARVRAKGQGGEGSHGGGQGDLYIRVHVLPHHRFTRTGDNLHVHVKVPLAVAVAGGIVHVQTLSGKRVELTIPPASGNGVKLRLRGQGMSSGGANGDLIAETALELPDPIPDELMEWAKQAREHG